MWPTTAPHDNIFDFNALLHPGTMFEHPRDVVCHPNLSLAEKRAILASWASDASAIASCPALRAPEGVRAPVTIDDILDALCTLDGGPGRPPDGKGRPPGGKTRPPGGKGHPPGGKPMRLRSVERRAA
jgi:hypothetical protein